MTASTLIETDPIEAIAESVKPSLERLRVLEPGHRIDAALAAALSPGLNAAEALDRFAEVIDLLDGLRSVLLLDSADSLI